MKEIPIHGGLVALVDDEDEAMVSGYSWNLGRGVNTRYARTDICIPSPKRTI